MGMQDARLKAGVDIIVVTPGRLMDHMRQQNADLTGIELLVLDEADRMMDMGFWPDVRRIIRGHFPRAQNAALFGDDANEVRPGRAGDHARRQIRAVGQRSAPAKSITHHAERVASHDKVQWLTITAGNPAGPVLISRGRRSAPIDWRGAWRPPACAGTALHADRSQDQRRIAVEGFKGGKYKVLVANRHRGARGSHRRDHTVINTSARLVDTYVHRVGRTGRSGAVGQANHARVSRRAARAGGCGQRGRSSHLI